VYLLRRIRIRETHPRSLRVPREMISIDEAMKRTVRRGSAPNVGQAETSGERYSKGTARLDRTGRIGESSLPFRDSEFGFQNAPPSSRA